MDSAAVESDVVVTQFEGLAMTMSSVFRLVISGVELFMFLLLSQEVWSN